MKSERMPESVNGQDIEVRLEESEAKRRQITWALGIAVVLAVLAGFGGYYLGQRGTPVLTASAVHVDRPNCIKGDEHMCSMDTTKIEVVGNTVKSDPGDSTKVCEKSYVTGAIYCRKVVNNEKP